MRPDSGEPADASLPDAGEPPAPRLDELSPSTAGASVGATVTLRGPGLGAVERVEVGAESVTFQVLDAQTLSADFPPVALTAVGKRTVRVFDSQGRDSALVDGFEYLFDEDPIVFVHGYVGNPEQFDGMNADLVALGYPADHLHALDIEDPYGSNLAAALELAELVDAVLATTGASKVDLVTHSMGGVAGRLYIKQHGGDQKVRDFASLAGAHHGAYMYACPQGCADLVCWYCGDGGFEMSTTYACEGEARNDVQFTLNGCLTATGRTVDADETPFGIEDGGGVAYLSLYSLSDGYLVPVASPCLNMQKQDDCSDPVNRLVEGVGHMSFPDDAEVFGLTVEHLRARNQSR